MIIFRCNSPTAYDAESGKYERCLNYLEVEEKDAGTTITCNDCFNDVKVPAKKAGHIDLVKYQQKTPVADSPSSESSAASEKSDDLLATSDLGADSPVERRQQPPKPSSTFDAAVESLLVDNEPSPQSPSTQELEDLPIRLEDDLGEFSVADAPDISPQIDLSKSTDPLAPLDIELAPISVPSLEDEYQLAEPNENALAPSAFPTRSCQICNAPIHEGMVLCLQCMPDQDSAASSVAASQPTAPPQPAPMSAPSAPTNASEPPVPSPTAQRNPTPIDPLPEDDFHGFQRWLITTMENESNSKIPMALIHVGTMIGLGMFGILMVFTGMWFIGIPVLMGVAAYLALTVRWYYMRGRKRSKLIFWEKWLWRLNLAFMRTIGWRNLMDSEIEWRVVDCRGLPPIDDQNLPSVSGLVDANVLDLTGQPITDQGLKILEQRYSLSFIVLYGTNVSSTGIFELQEALPKAWIWCEKQ